MKRRILAIFLTLSLIFSLAAVTGITASAETYDVWEYTILADDSVEVTGYSGEDVDVVIPDTIDGKTVTSIGDWAFYDCTALISIKIPDSVTSIGEGAFYYCTNRTSVTIPNSFKRNAISRTLS